MRFALLIALTGCGVGFTYEEPIGGSGGAGSGGNPSAQEGSGGSVGGAGGEGGNGGSAPAMLLDGELFARYWIDEAPDGIGAGQLEDDATNGQALLFYDATASMAYVEPEPSRRGLRFPTGPVGGQAYALSSTTKFAQLYGRTSLTIEAVASFEGVPTYHARLVHLGDYGSWSSIQLSSEVQGYLQLGLMDVGYSSWAFNQNARLVFHFVLDTEADDQNRALLYIDGVKVAPSTYLPPPHAATLQIEPDPTDDYFIIGNTPASDRSWMGNIHYVALYTTAMAPQRIAQHAAFLANRDDKL